MKKCFALSILLFALTTVSAQDLALSDQTYTVKVIEKVPGDI